MKQLRSRSRLLLLAGGLVFVLFLVVVPRLGGSAKGSGFGAWTFAGLLALAGVFVLSRTNAKKAAGAGTRLKLIERSRIQADQNLLLFEVDGQRMLISSSNRGLNLLARLENEDERDPVGGTDP